MAETQKFQLRPQVKEEGGKWWLWLGAVVVVLAVVIAVVTQR